MSDPVRPHRRQPTRLPPSLGFSRQEYQSGLPFPSPMHEREKWKWSRSVMSDSVTPWTAAYQAPPSTGFSRQEYWSGVPLPSPKGIANITYKTLDFFFYFFFFLPCHVPYGILVTRPGLKPVASAVEVQCLNHWVIREVPKPWNLKKMDLSFKGVIKKLKVRKSLL